MTDEELNKQLSEVVSKDWKNFRKEELERSKEEIFSDSGLIADMRSIRDAMTLYGSSLTTEAKAAFIETRCVLTDIYTMNMLCPDMSDLTITKALQLANAYPAFNRGEDKWYVGVGGLRDFRPVTPNDKYMSPAAIKELGAYRDGGHHLGTDKENGKISEDSSGEERTK